MIVELLIIFLQFCNTFLNIFKSEIYQLITRGIGEFVECVRNSFMSFFPITFIILITKKAFATQKYETN